jgi:PKD repeat protein
MASYPTTKLSYQLPAHLGRRLIMHSVCASGLFTHSDALHSTLMFVAAVLLLLIPTPAQAESDFPTGWVCFDGLTTTPTPPGIDIISSGATELVVRIETPGVLGTAAEEMEIDFRMLEFPSYYRSDEVGHPALPAVRQLIATPAGCSIDVSVSAPDSLTYSDVVVYPVPELVTKYTEEGYEYLEEEFAYDEEAYSTRGYYPTEIASLGHPGVLRGQGVALLTVYPIQFNAADEVIRVLPVVTVTLTFNGGAGGVSGDLGPFDSIVESVLLNYEGYGARESRAQADTGKYRRCWTVDACDSLLTDYLMIVQDSLYASPWIDELGAHRADWNGYNVAIVSDDALGAQISDVAIRCFIQDVYERRSAEHMSDGYLGYVLLVGDARAEAQNAYMPAHEEASVTTDHWYACMDTSDLFADLMIGRLCASDTVELKTEVEKFIRYERDATHPVPSWRDTALLSCGFAWVGNNCEDDSVRAAITDAAFDSISAFIDIRYSIQEIHAHEQGPAPGCPYTYSLTKPLNVQAINEGCHIVEFGSHGWESGMRTFDHTNVQELSNRHKLPFWISISCGTAAYDLYCPDDYSYDCLGEKLMHGAPDGGGAIAYLGASEGARTDGIGSFGRYIWDGMLQAHHYEIGQAVQYAKLKYLSRTGIISETLTYNLLGDPALNLELADHEGYGSAPDYVVSPDDLLSAPLFPSYFEPDTLSAVVHNISNYDPDEGDSIAVVFSVGEVDGGSTIFADTAYVRPYAWSTDTATVVWEEPGLTNIGELVLRVEVDTTGVELFKDNNVASRSLCIYFERPGFTPHNMEAAGGLSPVITDIDGLPGEEVLAAASSPGILVALTGDGDKRWEYPAPGGLAMRGPPAVGDLDFDGDSEVVICFGDSVLALSGANGFGVWDQPYRVEGLRSSPVLGDLVDGDGRLETIVQGYKTRITDAHTVTAITYSGEEQEWPHSGQQGYHPDFPPASPSLADLDGDGVTEVLFSFSAQAGGPSLAALDGTSGNQLWTETLETSMHQDAPCCPVVADLNADSLGLEVVCGAKTLCCLSATGNLIWDRHLPGLASGCAVGDVTGDDGLEIIVGVYSRADSLTPCDGWLFVLEGDGTVVDSTSLDYRCQGQPVIADLDGDSAWEIVVTSSCPDWEGTTWGYSSHLEISTLSPTGVLTEFLDPPRPLIFPGRLTSTPAIADTDDNGRLEIWLVDGKGRVHCLEWPGSSAELSRWTSFQHDERHTGTYETPVSGQYPPDSAVSWWGDYLLTGDVVIDSTSSLIVQPGTRVVATAYADTNLGVDPDRNELIINGGIVASGTSTRPTKFALEEGVLGNEMWRGIRVGPTDGQSHDCVGKFYGCTIDHAFIGIDAISPDTLVVDGCSIISSDVKGIQCNVNGGEASVTLSENEIVSGQIGMELQGCNATVDANTISDCRTYGIKLYDDYGSSLHSNIIQDPYDSRYYPFSGIFVFGYRDSLEVSANDIDSFSTTGIHLKSPIGTDNARVVGNEITGAGACALGMYFDGSWSRARSNSLTDVSTGFKVECDGYTPDLGTHDGTDGNNCVEIADLKAIQYYVRIIGSVQDSVAAECNYWWIAPGDSAPDPGKFSAWVDWNLPLDDCPDERGNGQVEEVESLDGLAFRLEQNRPNPFNPVTTIVFAVPEVSRVRLRIYDLAGRHVVTLVDGEREPGLYEAVWDGRSAGGLMAASGVYFCRLEVGGSTAAKKLVLLK